MNLTLDVSELNEGTEAPWWAIVDPRQLLRLSPDHVADMIFGPFFSRESAQAELDARRYAYGKAACVYCMSGYRATQYKAAYRTAYAQHVKEKR